MTTQFYRYVIDFVWFLLLSPKVLFAAGRGIFVFSLGGLTNHDGKNDDFLKIFTIIFFSPTNHTHDYWEFEEFPHNNILFLIFNITYFIIWSSDITCDVGYVYCIICKTIISMEWRKVCEFVLFQNEISNLFILLLFSFIRGYTISNFDIK